jgi:hypothetical protein
VKRERWRGIQREKRKRGKGITKSQGEGVRKEEARG